MLQFPLIFNLGEYVTSKPSFLQGLLPDLCFPLRCHILAMNLELGTFDGLPHGAPQFHLRDGSSLVIFTHMQGRQSPGAQGEHDHLVISSRSGRKRWLSHPQPLLNGQKEKSSSRQSTACLCSSDTCHQSDRDLLLIDVLLFLESFDNSR